MDISDFLGTFTKSTKYNLVETGKLQYILLPRTFSVLGQQMFLTQN